MVKSPMVERAAVSWPRGASSPRTPVTGCAIARSIGDADLSIGLDGRNDLPRCAPRPQTLVDTEPVPVMAIHRSVSEPLLARVQERANLLTRPGRRFAPGAERELEPVLRGLAARLPGADRGVTVIAEMPGPAGLPDLVAVPLTSALADRLSYGCPPLLSWPDIRIVAAASVNRPLSTAALSRRIGAEERVVRRSVPRLVRCGALIRTPTDCLVRPAAMQPVGRLYALEAKVADWSGGLDQALRYGAWADASAVVVSRLPQDHSKAIALARDLQLGLALGPRWLVRPTVRRLELARRLWASEHVVAALTGRHQIPSATA